MKKIYLYSLACSILLSLSIVSCVPANNVNSSSEINSSEASLLLSSSELIEALSSPSVDALREIYNTYVANGGTLSFEDWYRTITSTSSEELSSLIHSSSSSEEVIDSSRNEQSIQAYMNRLRNNSLDSHLYVHYERYAHEARNYNDYDIWAWPAAGVAGTGMRFDWEGTTTPNDFHGNAMGTPTLDEFGLVTVDIDLKAEYLGGWNTPKKIRTNEKTSFYNSSTNTLATKVGVMVVLSASRTSDFWSNDGGTLTFDLEDYALVGNNKTSYHIFLLQDDLQSPTNTPIVEYADEPMASDDGTNYTYGNSRYNNVNFSTTAAKQKTSKLFLQGDSKVSYLTSGAGVGYQISVASFADSDGDGLGDIYGIYNKLDYIKNLGVNVISLSPIQLSGNYDGHNVMDYTQIDPIFGSLNSPHSENGKITSASAMEDYKDLLYAAHNKGMAVIMSLNINSTAANANWFISSAKLDEECRGYYHWGNHITQGSVIKENNYWYPYKTTPYSYYAKSEEWAPELNYANISARDAIATILMMWCEIGVDGFNFSNINEIFFADEVQKAQSDTIIPGEDTKVDKSVNLTKNLHFWRQLAKDVKSVYPNCFFLGLTNGAYYSTSPYYEGFDSIYDYFVNYQLTMVASKINHSNADGYAGIPSNMNDFLGSSSSNPTVDQYGNKWTLYNILQTNNTYRGDSAIYSCNTTYDSIYRPLNMIASTSNSYSGVPQVGNVNTTTYSTYDRYATLVEITQLMLPGITWINYGDELGMTSNFPTNDSEYDPQLGCNQPMKWTKTGRSGDGSYTTGATITGHSNNLEWDNINSTNMVKSATEQLNDNSSHLNAIKTFAAKKSITPTLIRGSIEDKGWDKDYVVNIWRKLGSETYAFVANYNPTTSIQMGYGNDGWTVVSTFNGATSAALPPMSAVLLKK